MKYLLAILVILFHLDVIADADTVDVHRMTLRPMNFRSGSEGRLYKVFRTEPKETDVLLNKNLKDPFRSIGRIQARHEIHSWKGTASFISPCHILTDAHVVYSPEDENRLFARKGVKESLIQGEVLKVLDQINLDLKNPSANRSIRFDIARRSDGRFDTTLSPNADQVLWIDPQSDYGIVRLNRCLGVSEIFGYITVMPKEQFEEAFKKLVAQQIPVIIAGYPGDWNNDPARAEALKVNSSIGYERIANTLFHTASNFQGSSGSPIFVAYIKDVNGRTRPIEREYIRRNRDVFAQDSIEFTLVAINKSEDAPAKVNFAKLMNDDNIMIKVNKDFRANKALLEERIEEAKRDAAKYAQ